VLATGFTQAQRTSLVDMTFASMRAVACVKAIRKALEGHDRAPYEAEYLQCSTETGCSNETGACVRHIVSCSRYSCLEARDWASLLTGSKSCVQAVLRNVSLVQPIKPLTPE
jgi:hypothetical protein